MENPLGKNVVAPARYDASILFPIPRGDGRREWVAGAALPFHGEDRWLAWEVSWLNEAGMPRVAVAELRFPADSPAMIESKSLKLYLQSLNQTPIGDHRALQRLLSTDLSKVAGTTVSVALHTVDSARLQRDTAFAGECLDAMQPGAIDAAPDAARLAVLAGSDATERVYSHLFRSVCPVTGQPDWATIAIATRGARLDRAALLGYLLSFRTHAAYHEQCVERIWCDINTRCAPRELDVCAAFLRRGGLDISPRRYSGAGLLDEVLSARQ